MLSTPYLVYWQGRVVPRMTVNKDNVEPNPNQPRTLPPSPERKKPRLPRQYLVIVLVACAVSLLLSPPTFRTETAIGSTTAEGVPQIKTTNRLTIRLAQTLGEGEFTVVAKDLATGETYGFGQQKTYDAASTMKLLFAAYLYHQASEGTLDLDTVITIPAGQVQRYGTGTIQNEPGPYRYTYRELAKLMLEQSDNTAAFVLSNKLGLEELQTYGESLGMTESSMQQNTTTAADQLKVAEAVFSGKVASPELTAELLSIMDDSAFEDRLPAKLPADAKTYHKTGDAFGGGLHDVGVVEYLGHSYAIAIFTDHQGGDLDDTKSRMADASRDIFAYFNREK